jgi:ABC-type multidrug transport system fused ATPase/permease subunit
VLLACIFAIINGVVHPYLGVVYGKILNLLIIPIEILEAFFGPEYGYDELRYWVLNTVVMAVVTLIFRSLRGIMVGFIGQGITTRIRQRLYLSILEKDVGFFDYRENNASVLTSSMAEDTGLINGASTESLDPYIDSFFSLVGGIGLGFYFCWQMSLVCIALTPLMTLGQYIGAKYSKGLTNE